MTIIERQTVIKKAVLGANISGYVISNKGAFNLPSHLLEEEDPSKCQCMWTGGRGVMSARMFAYKFLKGLSRTSKRKRNTEMGSNCG